MRPLVSICIPAYKNARYLNRLLQSISIQTFKDFEVVITDDSNDDSVCDLINANSWGFELVYTKNEKALGSPENWNEGVRRSRGKWIKIMHHDDWFANENSLSVFVRNIHEHPSFNFFFCTYYNIYEDTAEKDMMTVNSTQRKLILNDPVALLSHNVLGPPSTTIYKNDKSMLYDNRLKWLVDMDFYISYLKTSKPYFIDEPLINIGVHKDQVTQSSFRNRSVEIPEHLIVLNKLGEKCLQNLLVYDAFWRLMRNLQIRSLEELSEYSNDIPVARKLRRIIKHQQKLPSSVISIGPLSKVFMFFSYLANR